MKNIFKIISVLSVMIIILTTSCSEKERTWLGDLRTGAYLQFVTVPDAVQGVNTVAELVYEGTLVDPTGNAVAYDLFISATLSGVEYGPAALDSWTTFPINLSVPVADMAAALGVTVGDVNFGDSFEFTAEVTHRNGTVYSSEEISFEDGVLEEGGHTNEEVLQASNGYRNGLIYGFTIGCPADTYNSANIAGTYDFEGWGDVGQVDIAVDGSDPNLLIVSGYCDAIGAVDAAPMQWTIDPATNNVTIDESIVLCDQFFGLGGFFYRGGGTVFPCAGNVFAMNMTPRLTDGRGWSEKSFTFTPAP